MRPLSVIPPDAPPPFAQRLRRVAPFLRLASFALLAALAGAASTAHADGLLASQTARDADFGSHDLLLPLFAPRSEADADLGVQHILVPEEDYTPLTLSLWTGYQFTDNARLSEFMRESDHLFVSNATVSWLPALRGNLFGEATVRHQIFRYQSLSDLDFNSIDAGGGLVKVLRELDDTAVFLRYNYSEFRDHSGAAGEIYSNHSLQTGAFKGWSLARDHFLHLSWLSDFSLDGSPGFAERHEHGVTLGYRITPADRMKIEFFHRSALLDFTAGGRRDGNHATGVSLTCNLTPHIYIGAHVAHVVNNSSLPFGGDYEAWSAGARLGGNFRY